MRPVRLDLDGFASFRDPARIDFDDTDYFAFVGPTGSGKSTVVDAMTFALYGSAPRWGSVTSIQYALAPTANRCTVRLIFDVAGQRYAVAREVRRSGQQISQKNCSLERYADPDATGDPAADEPTEILAEDPRGARAQIAELLGLDFEDFCTCVVLPQGDFATFLQASPGDRQKILLKLIGAKHYDAIGSLSGRRAAEAGTRIEVLEGQLAELADATEDAELAARTRETELAALQPVVTTAVAAISTGSAELTRARDRLVQTADETELLAAVAAPEGIGDLQQAVTATAQAYRAAGEQERLETTAAQLAQRAVDGGPQRRSVEDALRWRTDQVDGLARLGAVAEQASAAAEHHAAAELAAREAVTALDDHRVEYAEAGAVAAAADDALAMVQRRIRALAGIAVPDGIEDLATVGAAARAARDRAAQTVTILESDVAAARVAVVALPERSALDETARTITAYETRAAQLTALGADRDRCVGELAALQTRLLGATARRDEARLQWEHARVDAVAADLRPHLRVGETCPVCDQTVASLPPTAPAPLLDTASDALAVAERELGDATRDHQAQIPLLAALDTRLTEVRDRLDQLDRALAGRLPECPAGSVRRPVDDRSSLAAIVGRLDDATARQQELLRCLGETRTAVQASTGDLVRAEEASARARAELYATSGRLSTEHPPTLDATGLDLAWTELTEWAGRRCAELSAGELPDAQRTAEDAQADQARATRALADRVAAARRAGEASTAAALTHQRAGLAHQQLMDRLAELDRLLVDQPDSAELNRLLAECERLAEDARRARESSQQATTARLAAESARDASRDEWERARARFHTDRERLVPLGLPLVDSSDLTRAWNDLLAWTTTEIGHRNQRAASLSLEIEQLDEQLRRHGSELVAVLSAHGLDSATQPAQVVGMVMVERERARGRTAEVGRRREEAQRLRTRIARDGETQQVARSLQQLMSARKFPQWLATSALDTLVVDASASLMRLSNNQFDLTHDKGEFFVIDHADADSRRSVRTLSGGETFQASLALALALSEQLSTLAAGGRTTLDSIFLDEGFGTLDPDALEIVAGTLENLAQEDRMVGVITHVTALAERVPVRFEVSRDSRTSSIVRVGP